MIDAPACALAQLGYHIVAVAEKCDVEVDVIRGFAGDVDLWDLCFNVVRTAGQRLECFMSSREEDLKALTFLKQEQLSSKYRSR